MAITKNKSDAFDLTGKARRTVNEAAQMAAAEESSERAFPTVSVPQTSVTENSSTHTTKSSHPAEEKAPKETSSKKIGGERNLHTPAIGLYFFDDQIDTLRDASYALRRNKSEIMREAFDDWVKKNFKDKKN